MKDKKKTVVIQCKRYADANTLTAALKKELPKLRKLQPQRYVVATSASLTVAQKTKLVTLCKPWLKTEADIYARKDLNALLREYPQIESRHFKLWLQSTTVLETIFRSKIINQSHFKKQDIEALVKRYVVNASFTEAENILEKNRFVVISGIPGIGKSTLAYILAYTWLSRKDYTEFIYISASIDEGYEQFKDGIRQVFLFDDFLGQSFQDRKLGRNEDRRIIDFIRQVHKSKDKILLFTTREYILREVQLQHDLLNEPDIEFAKCLIDLSTYTKLIKAKILYNHLYFSGLPPKHLQAFALKKNYQPIINHRNYSPRIIEIAIRQELNLAQTSAAFVKKIIQALDNPFKIWETPFTDQITDASRILLTIVFTMGTPATFDDVREACVKFFEHHSNRYTVTFTTALFHKCLKELENSFLVSEKDYRNTHTLRFQNPSVQDFLLHYYKTNTDQLVPILKAAVFQEQFFHVFRPTELDRADKHGRWMTDKIVCDRKLNQTIVQRIIAVGDQLQSADLSVIRGYGTKQDYYQHSGHGVYVLLQQFQQSYHNTEFEAEVYDYTLGRMKNLTYLPPGKEQMEANELTSYISLLQRCLPDLVCDPYQVMQGVADKLQWLSDYQYYFSNLQRVFPNEYRDFTTSQDFAQRLYDTASDEMDNADPEYTEDLIQTLTTLQDRYQLNFIDEIEQLQQMATGPMEEDDRDDRFEYVQEIRNEDQEIDLIFSALEVD